MRIIALILLALVAACPAPVAPKKIPAKPDENACVDVKNGPGFAISAKADLRWKRSAQLQNDLMQALSLDPTLVCSELGLAGTCFNLIHQVPLGGNDPVKSGLYKPIDQPGITTPLSTDRVVLSACGLRADAESINALPKVVWKNIDFTKAKLDHADPAIATDVTNLYHLMLAREPTPDELTLVASLADDVNGVPVPPRDFAKMACYAVATTTEAMFQ